MKIVNDSRSPNFDAREIPVEFVVIHYTACGLDRALKHFLDQRSAVSSHLVIGRDGEIHELVPCLEGRTLRAWHSGRSRLSLRGKDYEAFNDFSIGIEVVNPNGNLFPYTDDQYDALAQVITHLQQHYPALRSPERIVGHENISSFRGKADPGIEFNWARLYRSIFGDTRCPDRSPPCPVSIRDSLRQLADFAPDDEQARDRFWFALSLLTERIVEAVQSDE